MQFTTGLFFIAQAVGVFSSAVSRDVAGECGDLGVMERVGLPVGVDQSSVRQCANGPSGSPLTGSLDKRDCWYGSNSGCSESGYCWARCGEKDAGKDYPSLYPMSPFITGKPIILT